MSSLISSNDELIKTVEMLEERYKVKKRHFNKITGKREAFWSYADTNIPEDEPLLQECRAYYHRLPQEQSGFKNHYEFYDENGTWQFEATSAKSLALQYQAKYGQPTNIYKMIKHTENQAHNHKRFKYYRGTVEVLDATDWQDLTGERDKPEEA